MKKGMTPAFNFFYIDNRDFCTHVHVYGIMCCFRLFLQPCSFVYWFTQKYYLLFLLKCHCTSMKELWIHKEWKALFLNGSWSEKWFKLSVSKVKLRQLVYIYFVAVDIYFSERCTFYFYEFFNNNVFWCFLQVLKKLKTK